MVKKIMVTAVVLLLAVTSVFAAPLRFVFGDLGQHPEILMGFLPSYLLAGAGYRPVELIEGDVTEIQLLAGLGYNQRKVWQDCLSGEVVKKDPIVYDVLETDWILRFVQGFGDSSVAGKDLLTITAGYEGKLEFALDSMVKGQTRNNGIQSVIRSLDDRIGTYDGDIYPDLRGNRTALGSVLALQLKYDEMDDRMTTTDGFVAKADLKWAPSFLNGALDGQADYYSLTLNAVAAKIDHDIFLGYRLYANNHVAADLLEGSTAHSSHYAAEERSRFEQYLQQQLQKVDIPDKDEAYLTEMMLRMYANPLYNQEKALRG